MRFGLRAKLLASVLVYLGLLAVVGLLGLYAAQTSLSGFDVALQHHVREISLLSDVSEEVSRVQGTVLLHIVADSPADRARYERRLADLEANIERLLDEQVQIQRRFDDEADVERIERFRDAWHAYLRARDEQLLPLSRDNRDEEALRLVEPNGSFDQTYRRVISELSTVQDTLEAESRERLEQSEADFTHNRDLLIGTLLMAGLFGIAFGLSHSSRLARAFEDVSAAARRVARGDFSPRLVVATGDEIQSLAESFNTMAANLERMDEEQRAIQRLKDEFVSTVSHELRTPMNGIIGMTDLLLAGELRPRERRYAEGVRRSGEALLAIVNDVLDFSKIEAGKLHLECIELDVRQAVDDVLELLGERAAGKGLELKATVADAVPPRVLGDPGRLRQVLTNLVGNAIKFTPAGGVQVRAALADGPGPHAWLRFEVEDTGIGIPAEAGAYLFEPFTQADGSTTRTHGGTGLGLSICKRLVGLMGGEIGFSSQPGVGSTFWFCVPAPVPGSEDLAARRPDDIAAHGSDDVAAPGPEDATAARPASSTEPPRSSAAAGHAPSAAVGRLASADTVGSGLQPPTVTEPALAGGDGAAATHDGPRVLLVEDSWINQQVALGMLEELGYPADVVDSGRAALRMLTSGASYAAVLMDCQMPGLDGYQTTAEIRRHEAETARPSRVPIVAFTASAMAGDRERCLAAGMSDYLAKPVHLADLGRVLARWAGPPASQPVSVPGPSAPAENERAENAPAGAAQAPAAGPGHTPDAEPPVLDQAVLDSLRRLQRPGRPDLVATVLDRFRAEAPAHLASLQAALEAADPTALWHTAHTLKGDSGRIGARQVQRLAADIERLGRAGSLAEAAARLPELQAALARLESELRPCAS